MAISINKYKNTIDLLKIYSDFLKKTTSKKGNLSLIDEQIELLEYALKNEIDLMKIMRDAKSNRDNKVKIIKFSEKDFVEISDFIKNPKKVIKKEKYEGFIKQFPNLKIIKSDFDSFEKEFKLIDFDKWKTDELKFILLHVFSSFPKSKKTKKEYFDLIIEYLYQRKYVESIEKTYSEQNKK